MEASEERVETARWAAAEASLYSSMVADPEGYQRVVTLIGSLLGHLRTEVSDRPALVAASARGVALVSEVSAASAVPGFLVATALHAACAVRDRELHGPRQRQERLSMLAQARTQGRPWVNLATLPTLPPGMVTAGAPGPSGTWVHVRSGAVVASSTEMDPDRGGVVFCVRGLRMDLDTAVVVEALAALEPDLVTTSIRERDDRVNELRRLVERLDSENHLV